jgi:hypothetical protein
VAATERKITYTDSIGNPFPMVVTAILLGTAFGFVSEQLEKVMTTRKQRTTGASPQAVAE